MHTALALAEQCISYSYTTVLIFYPSTVELLGNENYICTFGGVSILTYTHFKDERIHGLQEENTENVW